MAASAKSLMRAGLISPKASAKLAVLKGTRSQKSKMATFEHKFRDEGRVQQTGHTDHRGGHINEPSSQSPHGAVARQATRVSSGGSAHGAKYVPGKNQIDEFPPKQNKMRDRTNDSPSGRGAFPSGTNLGKRSGFKDLAPRTRGGKQNYRGNSYGAPNSRP